MSPLSVALTSVVSIGGQYCLLALAFAFVWWSSRAFFVAEAARIPTVGAMPFTLTFVAGMGFVPATILAVVVSVGLAAIIEAGVMRPMAGWRRGSVGGVTIWEMHDSICSFYRCCEPRVVFAEMYDYGIGMPISCRQEATFDHRLT